MNSIDVMNEVKKALLSENKIEINNLFTGEKMLAFKCANEDLKVNYSLTKYQIATLLRMSLFHLMQSMEKKALTEEKNYNGKIIIILLLHMAKDSEPENKEFLKECTNSIFKNPLVLKYFFPVYKKKGLMEKMFTDTFLEVCVTLYNLSKECLRIEIVNSFKKKLITQLKSAVEKCKTKHKMKHSVKDEFFQVLQLNLTEMIDLLRVIMELPVNRFLSSDKTCLSIWGVIVPKLIEACLQGNTVSHRNIFPLDVDLFKKLCSYLVDLKASKVDVGLWETSLYKYLQQFPHNIGNLDKKIFVLLLRNQISSATIDLISLLISRNPVVIPQLIKFTKKNETIMKKSDMIFRLLGSNLTSKWDKDFMSKLNELHKQEIIDYLTEPASKHSWIQENVKAVIYLIEANFDTETCQQICNTVLVSGDKLDKVDIKYVQLIETLFKKVKSSRDFVQVLIYLLASTLKLCKNKTSLSKNKNKLEFLCETLIKTINSLKMEEKNLTFEELSKNHSWPQFVRFSLRQGLKNTEEENTLNNALLLKSLIAACSVAYIENGNDEYIKTVFGLTTTHSEYADIMLSTTNIKRNLVELILVLVRKNRTTMLPNHIPLYLAAYNATLSESDQILLLIIKEYENCNINLKKYRPFLWGNSAAFHYSVKEDPNTVLFRQPKTSQILDLFVPEMVNDTITKFPVQRSLKDDNLCAPENVYDPVFYLPVLCEVLSENNPVAYHKVTHSGALALMLIACCSNCDQIRLAAFTDISRFYFHLEHLDVKRSNERLLWIRFIDGLRNGIVELGTSIKEVSLNGFMATFLARASIVGTQPLHPLYWPLHKFFMAKPALKLNTIPEFKRLFHSTEVDYEAHRNWILEVIRDGFKSESDIQVAINCSVFNVLLSFYVCSLSDKPTRTFILEIINSITKIPKSAVLLVNHYGIMPWLDAVTDRLETSDSDFVPLLIDMTSNFLDSFLAKKVTDKFRLFVLMHVLLTLKSAMTNKNVTVSCFTTYVDTLAKILVFKDLHLSQKHMKDLLELSKELLGCVEECEDLLEYGSEFALIQSDDQGESVDVARKSFRNLILKWHSYKKFLPKSEGVVVYPDGSVCKIPSTTK